VRVAILGSGNVGRTLASGFTEHGHEVVVGSRNPDSELVRDWLAATGGADRAVTLAEAAAWCEMAVFCPRWGHGAAENAARLVAADSLAGKIVIDTTNPLAPDPQHGPELSVELGDSAGEQVQRWFPDARVVKAFNTVGYRLMVRPDLPGGPPTMLICGDDENAKAVVAAVLEDFGWLTADLGGIFASRAIEGVALAWILYGRRTGTHDHAFKLLLGP
jgi:predicted dinucleotide-binding enzyme